MLFIIGRTISTSWGFSSFQTLNSKKIIWRNVELIIMTVVRVILCFVTFFISTFGNLQFEKITIVGVIISRFLAYLKVW
jgi:hypothetical protein